MQTLKRRDLLKMAGLAGVGLIAAACQPKIVEVTKIVEKPVEKVVKETVQVQVEKKVEVEKEVTRVVEKQVQAPKAPVTLIIQHVHPVYEKFGADTADPGFEKKFPDVKVKREFTAGYVKEFYPKLMTMYVGGTPWDVAELPSWAGMEYQLFFKGLLKELTPYVEKDKFDLNQFFKVAVDCARFRRVSLAMLPILVDPGQGVLVWNQDLFKKAGVPDPTPAWEYQNEFKQALAALNKALKPEKIWTWQAQVNGTFGYQAVLDAWNTTLFDEGGTRLLLDNDKGTAAMKFMNDLFRSGDIPMFGEMEGGAAAVFNGGKSAMNTTFMPVVTVHRNAVAGKFGVGATLMPKGPKPDGKNGGSANPHYMAINSNSKNPDVAWEYLKWFTGKEMSGPLWDAGLMPARPDTWADPKYGGKDPITALCAEQLKTVALTAVPANFRGGEIEDTLKNGLDAVWLGKTPFAEGFALTCANIRKVMEKPVS